ncbi:MAG: choice-of-anchor Q domain-containing protein [Saprospiraceae bacterium]
MKSVYILFVFQLIVAPLFSQNRWYVNEDAQGTASGASWLDAFTDLQDALSTAGAGDEIWVARGIYRPTNTADRNLSFEVPAGVKLYGGFAGTETALNERDWEQFPTILSGDIGIPGDSTDNSHNVLYMYAPDTQTVLDGFTVRDGEATYTGASKTYGRLRCGGGLYIDGFDTDAYPDIVNCNFIHNTARTFGGGIMAYGGGDGSTAPRVRNCHFKQNKASSGGGMARIGGSWIERGADLDSCRFIKNTATFRGGGYYYTDSERFDTLEIRNCLFEENIAENNGGGMFLDMGRINEANGKFYNLNFHKNRARSGPVLSIPSLSFLNVKSLEFNNLNISENSLILPTITGQQEGVSIVIFTLNNDSRVSICSLNIENDYTQGETASIEANTVNIKESLIQRNDCSNKIIAIGSSVITIEKMTMLKNNRQYNLLLLASNKKIQITNSVFVDNNLQSEFIIRSIVENSKEFNILNCTFFFNTVDTFVGDDPNPIEKRTITNCIFGKDEPLLLTLDHPDSVEISYCYVDSLDCFPPFINLTCGPGILTGFDPLFVNPDSGDYRLQPCSPLVNAGSNDYVLGDTDLAGRPRIRGGTVDIGAYEAQGPSLATAPQTTPSCPGGASGAVDAGLQGGCPPLLFNWQSGANSGATLSGLPPGVYQFTVTDAKGLTATFSATVPEGDAPNLTPIATALLCGDTTGGSATALLDPALPPLHFLWADDSTDSLRTGLAAGSYPLTVTDALGCSATGAVQVSKSGSLSVDIEAQAISCHATADGAFTVLPANGKPPFLWNWASGATGPTIGPLGPGTYSGTLTDALGCTIQWVLPLTEPAPLQLQALVTNAGDSAAANGSIQMMPTGGTMPYDVLWSTGAVGPQLDSLLPGMYTATLTDANGCSAVETYVVGVTSSARELANGPAFVLYPNPAEELVWLHLGAPARADLSLRVLNSAGQMLHSGVFPQGSTVLPLNVGHLPRGVYAVQLGGRVEKLVKR